TSKCNLPSCGGTHPVATRRTACNVRPEPEAAFKRPAESHQVLQGSRLSDRTPWREQRRLHADGSKGGPAVRERIGVTSVARDHDLDTRTFRSSEQAASIPTGCARGR